MLQMEISRFWLICFLLIILISKRCNVNCFTSNDQNLTKEINSGYCQLQPLLMISFNVNDDAHALPYFLGTIERLDYPKSRTSLWIRSRQRNSDNSSNIINRWLLHHSSLYHSVSYKNECRTINFVNDGNPLTSNIDWISLSKNNIDRFLCQQEALEDARKMNANYLFIIKPNVMLTRPSVIKYLMRHEDLGFVGPKIERTTWDESNVDLINFAEIFHYSNPENVIKKTLVEVMAVMHAVLINLGCHHTKWLTFTDFDYTLAHPLSKDVVLMMKNIRNDEVNLYQDNTDTFGFTSFDHPDADIDTRLQNFLHLKLQVMHDLSYYHFKTLLPSDILTVTFPPKSHLDFDKIYMINLAKRTDRLRKMEYCLDELGIEVERFEAVDGRSLNGSVLQSLHIKQLDGYLDPFRRRPLKLGEVGCFLSHYKIWQDVVKNGYNRVLIFEDDVRFRPNFKKNLQEAMNELSVVYPRWELFYLGRKILMPFEERKTDSDCIMLPSYSYWTVGYAITFKGAKKLIDEKPLYKMVALDEYLSIMFNHHPNQEWQKAFSERTLMAASANPLLIDPTGINSIYESDTESTDIVPEFVLKRRM